MKEETSRSQAVNSDERGLVATIVDGLRAAGRLQRVAVGVPIVALAGITAFLVLDVLNDVDRPPTAIYRAWGVALTNLGLAVLLVGHSVHAAVQAAGCSWASFDWVQTRRFHATLRFVPVLGIVALCLQVGAVALMVPSFVENPRRLVLLVVAAVYCLWAARMTVESIRFLYRHGREQAEAAAAARTEAAEATLGALQAQMNPHFLFNALNTVASLVRTDPPAAESTVENLAVVLRRTLDRSRRVVTTLADEVDYLEAYLAVETERRGERLAVQWEIRPEALDHRLPPMTLQPLVENALEHGVGERLDGGRVRIAARVAGDRLVLEVEDDGPGFRTRGRPREGTGLGNLRRRLATLYGDAAGLEVVPPSTVRVTVPLDPAALRLDDGGGRPRGRGATAGRDRSGVADAGVTDAGASRPSGRLNLRRSPRTPRRASPSGLVGVGGRGEES